MNSKIKHALISAVAFCDATVFALTLDKDVHESKFYGVYLLIGLLIELSIIALLCCILGFCGYVMIAGIILAFYYHTFASCVILGLVIAFVLLSYCIGRLRRYIGNIFK